MKKNNLQNGNALFLILIAIALLGLLTVTMSRSGSNSNDTGSFEQNQISSNEVLAYAKSIENAVQLLLSNGCSENELSFWHDSNGDSVENASDDYYNSSSPTDHSCHIFDVAGAGMVYTPPNEISLDSTESAKTGYGEWFFSYQSNITENGTGVKILAIVTPYVTKNICIQINKLSNVVTADGNPPKDSGAAYNYASAAHKYTGSLPPTGGSNALNPISGELDGKRTGCFEGDTFPAGGFHVYHALITK